MPFWKKKPKIVEVRLKFVYYGPPGAGTYTNLVELYELANCQEKDELTKMAMEDGESENLLLFEMTPAGVSFNEGYKLGCSVYRPFGPETRKLIMNGVNGIIFVADSSKDAQDANSDALKELEQNLNQFSLSLNTIPWVIQYNKRDLPEAVDVTLMNSALNKWNVPYFEAVASESKGVLEPFEFLLKHLVENFDYNGLWVP